MGIGIAVAIPTCDECKKAVGDLQVRLTSQESIAEQKTILILRGCIGDFATPECEEAVQTYWPEVGPLTFNYFFTEKEPCGPLGLDVCKRSWTCEEWTGAIGLLSNIMTQEEYVAEIITYLQGDAFCNNGDAHTPECPEHIAIGMPIGLEILSQVVVAKAEHLCQEVVGVC